MEYALLKDGVVTNIICCDPEVMSNLNLDGELVSLEKTHRIGKKLTDKDEEHQEVSEKSKKKQLKELLIKITELVDSMTKEG